MTDNLRLAGFRLVATVLLVSTVASPVLADTVMLRSGEQVKGTVANRELFRVPLPRMQSVAILASDSTGAAPVLRRFEIAAVDAVVIEQDGKLSVFDLKSAPAPNAGPAVVTRTQGISEFPTQVNPSDTGRWGAVATLFGLASFALGVGAKFGGPTVKVTENGITGQEHSYNAANYTLMGVGIALVTIGIVSSALSASHEGTTSELETSSPRGAIAPTTYVGMRIAF